MIWLPDLLGDNYDAIQGEHSPLVAELIAVSWPAPDGTIYYCSTQADTIFQRESPVRPVEVRFEREQFQGLEIADGIADSRITLNFWDGDGAIAELHAKHGPGARVEVFYWFPEHSLLLSQWHGHLDEPDEEDGEFFRVEAAYGFRSAQLPLPRRAFYTGCQAIFPVGRLLTQAAIDENDCPYNRHIGGSFGLLDGGQPFADCPRNNRAACTARLGDSLSYLGFDTIEEGYPNANLISQARSNTNNLKRPLRVVFGPYVVRDLDLLGFAVDVNTNHPDKGWVLCSHAVCEGEVAYVTDYKIAGQYVGLEHQTTRTGARRQAKTFFTPNEGNMSGTARAVGRIQGNFQSSNGSDLSGQVRVGQKIDTKVYTSATEYTLQGTNNSAWVFLAAWTDQRWGYGAGASARLIEDVIRLAAWSDENVTTLDANGAPLTSVRNRFTGQFLDKTAQRHIYELCLANNFSTPFPHRGETRILGLSKETNLDACPVFTDEGESRNICLADEATGKTSLTTSKTKISELGNRVVITYEDATLENQERTLTFEDVDTQLRAGRSFGDNSRFPVTKSYKLFGVTEFGAAVRQGNLLLDLGPFAGTTDEGGGLVNNRRIKFTTWFSETLTLHKYKVIKVVSSKLTRYGFEYWRICSLTRQPDLKVEIIAQAYPVDYYEKLESGEAVEILQPGSGGGDPNPGGKPDGQPEPLSLGDVQASEDKITFVIE